MEVSDTQGGSQWLDYLITFGFSFAFSARIWYPPHSPPPIKIALRTDFFFIVLSTYFPLILTECPELSCEVRQRLSSPAGGAWVSLRVGWVFCPVWAAICSKLLRLVLALAIAFILLLGLVCHYCNTVTLDVRCQTVLAMRKQP